MLQKYIWLLQALNTLGVMFVEVQLFVMFMLMELQGSLLLYIFTGSVGFIMDHTSNHVQIYDILVP
jgi:hypothetical protein